MISALKGKEELVLSTLRLALAAIKNLEIEKQHELSDEEVTGVLQSQAKNRKESIAAFRAGGRDDLASKEGKELEILSKYLPRQFSAEELEKLVRKIIAKLNAGPADFGKVMKEVMVQVKGKAEGNQVAELVKRSLQ